MSRNRPFGDIAEGSFFVYDMTIKDIHTGDIAGMDYLEIMDFCGFDLERADRMARELYDIDGNMKALKRHGVESHRLRPNESTSRMKITSNTCSYFFS